MEPCTRPDPLTVAIIVERDAAGRILELADEVHVWAVYTAENRRAAEQVRLRRKGTRYELSMTMFGSHEGPSDQIVASALDVIDLHHGDLSQVPPWSRALVFGAAATPGLVEDFRRLGFTEITETDTGFTATRSGGAG